MEERLNTFSDQVRPVFPVVGLHSDSNSRLGFGCARACHEARVQQGENLMLRRLLIAGWMAALLTVYAVAQQAGQIVGSVTDNKGAAGANATVRPKCSIG